MDYNILHQGTLRMRQVCCREVPGMLEGVADVGPRLEGTAEEPATEVGTCKTAERF